MKSTLQWTEHYLSAIDKAGGELDNLTITAITDLLKFHASRLPDSAEARLLSLENQVRALTSDASLAKIRSGR